MSDEPRPSADTLLDALDLFNNVFHPTPLFADLDDIDSVVRHWCAALAGLTDRDLALAAHFWVRTGGRYPSPYDLLEAHRLICIARTVSAHHDAA